MRVVLLLVACVVSFPHILGVNAHRHDGGHRRGKHPRAANLSSITPEKQNNTEVVAQVGGTASIKCYTHLLGDEVVTWMKRDQDQLLTAGGQVYSSESRYSVAHVRHQKLWELSLRDVRVSDAGMYECQVTSHPPASLFFILKVVEARAVIQGAPEIHVHRGVRLRLQCGVELATEPPAYIFWYHNDTMINYHHQRRPLRVVRHHHGSSLIIHNVTWADAGSYTCEPYKAKPANVTLHVIAEEKHAALHNGHSDESEQLPTSRAAPSLTPLLLIGSCLFILLMDSYFDKSYGFMLSR